MSGQAHCRCRCHARRCKARARSASPLRRTASRATSLNRTVAAATPAPSPAPSPSPSPSPSAAISAITPSQTLSRSLAQREHPISAISQQSSAHPRSSARSRSRSHKSSRVAASPSDVQPPRASSSVSQRGGGVRGDMNGKVHKDEGVQDKHDHDDAKSCGTVSHVTSTRSDRKASQPSGAGNDIGSGPTNRVGRLETLGLVNDSEARRLLARAARQALPIMERHGWRVGVLAETFHPLPGLLGLNHKQGRRIEVRVRHPFDASHFLPYACIFDTLLHELVHNEIGPHDDDFYKLRRQLYTECDDMYPNGPWPGGCRRALRSVPDSIRLNPPFVLVPGAAPNETLLAAIVMLAGKGAQKGKLPLPQKRPQPAGKAR